MQIQPEQLIMRMKVASIFIQTYNPRYTMKGSNKWDHRGAPDLQIIKQEHLLRHFQQIATITCKHYHYAFQIIKHLHQLQPQGIIRITQQIALRKKKFAFNMVKRKVEDIQYNHSKASLLIASFLQRKVIGIQVKFITSLKKKVESEIKARQLFLLLKLSNFGKLLSYTKADAFQCLKNQHFIRTQEIRKVVLIKMEMTLNNYINRVKIDGFLSIKHPNTKGEPQDDMEDAEEIFVQSYKTMACNLKRSQNRIKPLQLMKRQAALEDISNIITLRQQTLLQSCLTDLLCYQNHRFTPSTLAVLRREIAILEQEYESV